MSLFGNLLSIQLEHDPHADENIFLVSGVLLSRVSMVFEGSITGIKDIRASRLIFIRIIVLDL